MDFGGLSTGNGNIPDSAPHPPKGPSRTKNSTESQVSTGSKFATAVRKRYGECSEVLVFLRKKKQENGTDSKRTTAVAKYYGFGCRTIFSTEGSFGQKNHGPQHLQRYMVT